VAPGGKGVLRQAVLENSGAGRALAPSGRQVPPGGLNLFRQACWLMRQAIAQQVMSCVCCF